MIALICTQCRGKLEVEKDESVFISDGVAILRAGTKIKCPYCGTEFLPGDEMQATGNTVIIGNGNVVGNNNVVVSPFNQTGQKVKYQVNIGGRPAQVGVIGDGVTIVGGIHL